MGTYNNWKDKVKNAETELDCTQWDKMLSLLHQVEQDPKPSSKTTFINRTFFLLWLLLMSIPFALIIAKNKINDLRNSQESIQKVKVKLDQNEKPFAEPRPVFIQEKAVHPFFENPLNPSIIVQPNNCLDAHWGEESKTNTQQKEQRVEQNLPSYLMFSLPKVLKPDNFSKPTAYFLPSAKSTNNPSQNSLLMPLAKIQKRPINEILSKTGNMEELAFPKLKPIKVRKNRSKKNALELQYFHGLSAVYGVKLFYKRDIPISDRFGITTGIGASWSRGIEAYQNNIVTTDSTIINRQEGYSFQSDLHLSFELMIKYGNLNIRGGIENSFTIINSLQIADAIQNLNTNGMDFRVYPSYNEFDHLNRLGFVIHAGVDYSINENYRLGLGFQKRLNSYFISEEGLDILKNNNALALELRIARRF